MLNVSFQNDKNTNFSSKKHSGDKYLPNAFTEQGVAMLSGILKSDRAINVNIQIMRIFTNMRNAIASNNNIKTEIEALKQMVNNNTKNIELVFQYLDELIEKKKNQLNINGLFINIGIDKNVFYCKYCQRQIE